MSELFRFVSLRGPAPLEAETVPYVVPVEAVANPLATMSAQLDRLVERAASVGWNFSLKTLDRWLQESFDGVTLTDITGENAAIAEARTKAEEIVSRAVTGAAETKKGEADRASVHVLMAEWLVRVAALSKEDPFHSLTEAQQAAKARDYFSRAVLVAQSAAETPFTMKTTNKRRYQRKASIKPPNDPSKLRILLAQARQARTAVIAALANNTWLDLESVTEQIRLGLAQVVPLPGGELAGFDVSQLEGVLGDLDRRIQELVALLADAGDYSEGQPLRGEQHTIADDVDAVGGAAATPPIPIRIGVGDLLLAELQSTDYGYGDIAHIENVLAGEKRKRTFNKSSSRETDVFTLTESETTTETDTQSTQRFELEKASQSSLKETLNINAGTSISGSYGPVTAQASFGIGSTTGRESSQNQATKLAQEVVSKAASKVRQLSSTQTRTITKVVTTDATEHSVENDGADPEHIIGVYRWVNKLENLQLMNYGQRLMLGMTIPEPGAYLRWLAATKPQAGGVLPPTVLRNGTVVPLDPTDVTPDNYLTWVSAYSVADATPPPPRFITQAIGMHSDPNESAETPGTVTKSDTTLTVPAGYRSVLARGTVIAYYVQRLGLGLVGGAVQSPDFQISIATTSKTLALDINNPVRTFSMPLASPGSATASGTGTSGGAKIPIALTVAFASGYALTVEVVFERSDVGLATWQLDTWGKIMTAYSNAAGAAADAAARGSLPGVTIGGNNPMDNRRIERAEIKRNAIELLAGAVPSVDAVDDDSGIRPHPNPSKIAALDALIRFFDDAFEWEHMSWVSLDYFWAPETSWDKLMAITDPDTDRRAFLAAGAANVSIPVRRGFETVVLFRLWTGRRWPGDRAPLPKVAEAIALGAEVATSNKGAPQRGIPVENGAWIETSPTDLVILQPEGLLTWKPTAV